MDVTVEAEVDRDIDAVVAQFGSIDILVSNAGIQIVNPIELYAFAVGISEDEVVRKVMPGDTVDGEFTTVEDVAQTVLFLSAFPSAAFTGQSFVVSHGWFMQ